MTQLKLYEIFPLQQISLQIMQHCVSLHRTVVEYGVLYLLFLGKIGKIRIQNVDAGVHVEQ